MIATLTAIAALAGAISAPPVVSVNVKNGDSIQGEFVFRVTVQSEKPVTQVEFYVGDDLRDTDTSTPYEFKIDTLSMSEGELKVSFAAYTTENESAKKTVSVQVDNGVAKGAEFHVERAREMLTVSNWDGALHASRVALKAKTGYNPARLTMARAFLGKGVLDSAQRFAEDAVAADPKFMEASELLTAINLQRAFNTFHRGSGDAKETLASISSALKSAVDLRRDNLHGALDRMTPTPENAAAYADLALKAGRPSGAIQALSQVIRTDSTNPAIVNRMAYAQMRMSRFDDAFLTFAESKRRSTIDAYGYALLAIIEFHRSNMQASDDALREAILSDTEDLGVRTAQAYLAIARDRVSVLGKLTRDLARDLSPRTEVQYYLAILYNATRQFSEARTAFERCVLSEPLTYDMYVERGNEALAIASGGRVNPDQNQYHFQVAKVFYEVALAAKPDSAEALTGLCFAGILNKNTEDAYRFAKAAASAAPGYPAGRYAFSMMSSLREAELKSRAEAIRRSSRDGNLTDDQKATIARLTSEANRLGEDAMREMDAAGKLDKANLEGRNIPNMLDAYRYFARYGRLPLIAPPK